MSTSEQNNMAGQLQMSLISRWQASGVPSTLFRTEYRMVPQIAKLIDDVVYHGALEDGKGTAVDTRPLAQEVAKFNCAKHKTTLNNVVMLDILPLTS
ncbi:hypothetical protein KCU88_g7233, partial [Aureobasidium melanogenum]